MSSRESFADVMHALRTKAYEARESDRPWMPSLPTLELEGIIDRLQAAHDRETRNPSLAHMRESRERYAEEAELRAEFHRGYEAGKRAMDADHKAVALRLMGLDLDGDSHTMLSRIAYAIYPCATGWTKESCEGLAERIVHLLGGDGIGPDNACECGGAGCARAGDSDGQQAAQVTYDELQRKHERLLKERDELQAKLDEADSAIKNYRERLESFNESERLREELRVERDELRAKLDEIRRLTNGEL